jgi:VanZ family protein
MKRAKQLMVRWLPLVLWMALIFTLSNQPSQSLPNYGQWDYLVKKGGHMLGYGILALLALRTGLSLHGALLLVLAYAASDEFHQRFVSGRHSSPIDVLIDLLGAAVALLLAQLVLPSWRESRSGRTGETGEQSPRDA